MNSRKKLYATIIPAYWQAREEAGKQGWEKGIQEGIQIGEKETMKKIAIKMLAHGDNIEDIAYMTELSVAEIEQLKS